MLMAIPSRERSEVASSPVSSIGIFTTTLACQEAISRPSSSSPATSRETHSAETGPFTASQISTTRSR